MFLINSRLGRFAAAPTSSGSKCLHRRGRPFSRSYGASMPSSLTVVLPIASVCSTRPPVSVLVRAPTALPRGFSRKHGLTGFARSLRLASQASCRADFHALRPTRFHGDVQNPARLPRGFSRKHGLTGFARSLRLASQASCRADFHALRPTRFHGDVQNPARLPFSVAPSVMPRRRRCGNVCPLRIGYASRPRLTRCASATPRGLALAPD